MVRWLRRLYRTVVERTEESLAQPLSVLDVMMDQTSSNRNNDRPGVKERCNEGASTDASSLSLNTVVGLRAREHLVNGRFLPPWPRLLQSGHVFISFTVRPGADCSPFTGPNIRHSLGQPCRLFNLHSNPPHHPGAGSRACKSGSSSHSASRAIVPSCDVWHSRCGGS